MPQDFRRIEDRPVSTAILEPRLRKGSVGRVEVVSPAQMQPLSLSTAIVFSFSIATLFAAATQSTTIAATMLAK